MKRTNILIAVFLALGSAVPTAAQAWDYKNLLASIKSYTLHSLPNINTQWHNFTNSTYGAWSNYVSPHKKEEFLMAGLFASICGLSYWCAKTNWFTKTKKSTPEDIQRREIRERQFAVLANLQPTIEDAKAKIKEREQVKLAELLNKIENNTLTAKDTAKEMSLRKETYNGVTYQVKYSIEYSNQKERLNAHISLDQPSNEIKLDSATRNFTLTLAAQPKLNHR